MYYAENYYLRTLQREILKNYYKMAVLEKIRVKMGWFITLVIALALLSFIIDPETLQRAMSMFSSQYDVGEIDGKGVSYQEFQKKVDYYSNIYQMTAGPSKNDQTQEIINNTAWQDEIAEKVILPTIEKAGVTLGEDEIYDLVQGDNISPVVANDPIFRGQDGSFDKARVKDIVQAMGDNPQLQSYWGYLEDNIVKDQLFTKYLSLIEKSSYMSPALLNRTISENNTTYNVDFVMKPFVFAVDSSIVVSDDEIKNYYNANKDNFKQVESRDLEYVVFEVVPSAEDIALTQSDIEKVYPEFTTTDNMKSFLARNSNTQFNPYYFKEGELAIIAQEIEDFAKNAKVGDLLPPFQNGNDYMAAKLLDIKNMPDSVFVKHILLQGDNDQAADSLLALVKKGEDFSKLAAENSADKNPNVAEPGDIGWLTQQYMIPGFEQIFDSKKGDVLKIKTNYGTHIVKIGDVTKPVKKVQVAVLKKETVAGKKTYSNYYAQANEIVSESAGDVKKFNNAATKLNVPVYPAIRVLPGAKTLANYQGTREITRWANENEVGSVSPIITVDNKYFFVVALTAIHNEGIAPLNEVSNQIKDLLLAEKKGVKAGEDAKIKVGTATTIEEVAEKLETTVSSRNGISFSSLTSQQLDPRFIGAIAGAKENTLVGPVVGNIGVFYFVVKGKEVGSFYTEDDAKQKNAQTLSFISRSIPVIMSEKAGVKDTRYKFY